MNKISTIGLDLAKSVFQAHGVDGAEEALLQRRLRRGEVLGFFAGLEPCLVGMEACATAHHWAREIAALGHEVRLMPPAGARPRARPEGEAVRQAAEACPRARPGGTTRPMRRRSARR